MGLGNKAKQFALNQASKTLDAAKAKLKAELEATAKKASVEQGYKMALYLNKQYKQMHKTEGLSMWCYKQHYDECIDKECKSAMHKDQIWVPFEVRKSNGGKFAWLDSKDVLSKSDFTNGDGSLLPK